MSANILVKKNVRFDGTHFQSQNLGYKHSSIWSSKLAYLYRIRE